MEDEKFEGADARGDVAVGGLRLWLLLRQCWALDVVAGLFAFKVEKSSNSQPMRSESRTVE
mgnify:CR=1 FL=1